MTASAPSRERLDEDARAELLCYLVVGQLVAHARTGEWLRTDHLVEATHIWLGANGATAHWSERLKIGVLSARLACDFQQVPDLADSTSLAKLFTDGWRLDYRSSMVREIHDICARRLASTA